MEHGVCSLLYALYLILRILQQIIPAEIGAVSVHFSQDDIRSLGKKFFRQGNSEPVRVFRRTFQGILDDAFPVHAAHEADEL